MLGGIKIDVLLNIFLTFFKIGFISFGGGYAIIPIIEREVVENHWLTARQLTDAIAIAGISPGPIAANSAIFVGFKVAGIVGAIAATLGIVLPSLLLILIIAKLFYKFHEIKIVQDAFYGLRPVIVGLIAFAAIKYTISNSLLNRFNINSIISMGIIFLTVLFLTKTRLHPIFIIIGSTFIGILFLNK